MKHVSFQEALEKVDKGLVLWNCGGCLKEWQEGVIKILTEKNIATRLDFDSSLVLTGPEERKDLVLPFKKKNNINLDRLGIWMLEFGDVSLFSDYIQFN